MVALLFLYSLALEFLKQLGLPRDVRCLGHAYGVPRVLKRGVCRREKRRDLKKHREDRRLRIRREFKDHLYRHPREDQARHQRPGGRPNLAHADTGDRRCRLLGCVSRA